MRPEWKPKESGEEFLKHLIDTAISKNYCQLVVVLVGNKNRIKESLDAMKLYLTLEELKTIAPLVLLDSTIPAHKKLEKAVIDGDYDGSKVILCDAEDRKCKEWCCHALKGITDWQGRNQYPNGMLVVTGTQLPDEETARNNAAYRHRMVYIDMCRTPATWYIGWPSQIRMSADSMMIRLREHGEELAKEWKAKQK